MAYSKTDIGLIVGIVLSFVFEVVAAFRPNDVLPANDQAQIIAGTTSLVIFVLGLVGNRGLKHISGAR